MAGLLRSVPQDDADMTGGGVLDEFIEDADRVIAAVFVVARGDRTEFGLVDEAHEAFGVADDFNLVKRHQGVERAFVLDGEIVRAALAVPICQCASPAQLGVSTWVQRYTAVIAARLSSSCGLTT